MHLQDYRSQNPSIHPRRVNQCLYHVFLAIDPYKAIGPFVPARNHLTVSTLHH